MQIILNTLWTFIIIHHFIWQQFRLQHMVLMLHLMHIYLFGASINRMLILQLKIFLSVNLCFHFDSLYNLAFISHFNAVECRCSYNTNVYYFHCHKSSDVCPNSSKNRILNETLTYQKLNIIKIIYYLARLFRV